MKQKNGFTLIDIMIVMAILAILAAIAVPAFNNYLEERQQASVITPSFSAETTMLEYVQHMYSPYPPNDVRRSCKQQGSDTRVGELCTARFFEESGAERVIHAECDQHGCSEVIRARVL